MPSGRHGGGERDGHPPAHMGGAGQGEKIATGRMTMGSVNPPIILRTKKVTKLFGGLAAVKEVDLEIKRGEIFGLIGPNGAGKTTLFNLISGVYRPSGGTIEFNGQEYADVRHPHQVCRMGIARTFQIVKPFGNLTAPGECDDRGLLSNG